MLRPLLIARLSQGLYWFGKESGGGEIRALVLCVFAFNAPDPWVFASEASPAPPAPPAPGCRLRPAQMTAGPKGRVLAAPRRPVIGSAGTLHQRSHFNETDQVLASLRRKQKAFNPLISEN